MICNIRGTSGSGKTWVMREFMRRFSDDWKEVFWEGRRNPIAYEAKGVTVLGSYRATCGGCDGIGSAREVFDTIQAMFPTAEAITSAKIVMEGLLLSEDVKHSLKLPDLRVLFLATPLETCLTQIESRRKAAGNEKPLNPANTSNRIATIERARGRLLEAGVPCYRTTAKQAPGILLNWLRLHAE